MTPKKNTRKKAKLRRHHTPLQKHRRDGKRLITPLNTLAHRRPTNWIADYLPELLFAAAMIDEYGHPEPAWRVLEVLEPLIEGEDPFLDGHVSTFARIPTDARAEAHAALGAADVPPIPQGFLHGLALYPDGPAAWLAEMTGPIDTERGIGYLKRIVDQNLDSRDVSATQLRFVPVGRMVLTKRISVPAYFLKESYIPRYPGDLTAEEQQAAESEIRAMYMALRSAAAFDSRIDDEWPRYFWRQNYRISVCEIACESSASLELTKQEDAATEPAEPKSPTVGELRAQLVRAGKQLASDLRNAQQQIEIDLYAPEVSEVKLGLASRQVRLLQLLLSDAHLWSAPTGAQVLRALVDNLITASWLLLKDDSDLYLRYRAYGLGKLKLFKLHLEDYLESRDDDPTAEQLEFLQSLEDEVSSEILEEFIDIDFGGNFAGVDVRTMALEVDLKQYYDLAYQPYSSEAHGDWVSLKRTDLIRCRNPLHRYHRIGRFGSNPAVQPEIIQFATELTEMTARRLFDSCGVSVENAFADFDGAVFHTADEETTEETAA